MTSKRTRTFKPDTSKCLTDYFYFIDPELGLCFVRVPTWAPFMLTIYFNGHAWLATQLKARGLEYELRDRCLWNGGDVSARHAARLRRGPAA